MVFSGVDTKELDRKIDVRMFKARKCPSGIAAGKDNELHGNVDVLTKLAGDAAVTRKNRCQ